MEILSSQVSILLMKEDNDGNRLDDLNDKASKLLSAAFGGVTIVDSVGTWCDSGKLYQDKSYKFSCNFSGKLTAEQWAALVKVVKMEFKEGKQQAVSVFFNGSLAILDNSNDLQALKKLIA